MYDITMLQAISTKEGQLEHGIISLHEGGTRVPVWTIENCS
jgi:hypothetical protein